MNADAIGKALRGRRTPTGWLVRCPVPSHGKGRGDRNPSLSVGDGDNGRLLLNCFGGCAFEDILAELKRLGLADNRRPSEIAPFRRQAAPSVHEPDEAALKIWNEAEPAQGSPVQEYLERRGILTIPRTIRCGWVCHLGRVQMPVMVAAVQRPDGVIVATQTTILTYKGTKASVSVPKLTHGPLGVAAFHGADATATMGVAEGVETALSAQIMADMPVWASLGGTRLHRVALPSIVREVHIFADNDEPSGRTAADRAAKVHLALGRRVLLRFPPEGMDYNDFLTADADGRLGEIIADASTREAAA